MMKMLQLSILFMICLFLSSVVLATEIDIDGELDESLWQHAQVIDEFKVTRPLSLNSPPNKTQVLVTSTKKGLYIGFINEQQVDESIAARSLRDADITTDYNEVIIDFDAQGVRAFGFKVSRSGAVQDSIWSDENRESADWDASWQHAVAVEDDHWVSEIFIPWTIVSMLSSEGELRDVKLYFSRLHQGKAMRFSYPAIDRSQKTFIGNFQPMQLTFGEASSLDFFPYVAYNDDLEFNDNETRVGIDIFWKPSIAQQLNVTLNPDFGQVESDNLVVNFSAVETFFSEKRPFFRENHDLFDLQGPENLRLVHTPRIGGASDIEDAKSNDIDGAARYNFIGESIDIGVFSAFEDDTRLVQGRDYFAARAQYKFNNGRIGVLQTVTQRPTLGRDAKVSVADFQLEPTDELRLSGQYIHSGIDTETNTDVGFIKNSTTDSGWWLAAEWEPFDELSHEFYLYDYGKNFDVSDFGFVERVNRQQWTYEGSYQWTDLESNIRDIEWTWFIEGKDNEQNQDLPMAVFTEVELTFNSTHVIEFEFEYSEQGIDDLITRGNNPVRFPSSYKTSIKYESQQNSAFTYEIDITSGVEYIKGNVQEIEFIPAFQMTDSTDLSLQIEWEKSDSWVIWDEDNTLEEFKRDELSIAFNLNSVIAEGHELRLKLELVALEATALNEYEVDGLGNLTVADEPPDSFSLSESAVQLRYRYEISELSDVFVVYSRGGEFEKERLGFDRFSLINRSIDQDDNENVVIKLKMHF